MLPTVRCRYCGSSIALVRTAKNRMMPLDPEPDDTGNVLVVLEGGRAVAHVVGKDQVPLIGTLFMPHFATCRAYDRGSRRQRPRRGR